MNNEAQKRAQARTVIVKAVFPGTTNHYQTLFGGTTLQWMDEVAFITATRYGRKKFVTVSSDRIDFKEPIPAGHIVELIGEVGEVGRSSVVVEVSIFVEEMYSEQRKLAVNGHFTLVAVGEDRRPIAINN